MPSYVTILITPKGNIHNRPIISYSGLPIKEADEYIYDLENIIEKTSKSISLNNNRQHTNLLDSLKIACRKYTKEKTGKKPLTKINLVKI